MVKISSKEKLFDLHGKPLLSNGVEATVGVALAEVVCTINAPKYQTKIELGKLARRLVSEDSVVVNDEVWELIEKGIETKMNPLFAADIETHVRRGVPDLKPD